MAMDDHVPRLWSFCTVQLENFRTKSGRGAIPPHVAGTRFPHGNIFPRWWMQVGEQRAADRFSGETLDSMRFVQVTVLHENINK